MFHVGQKVVCVDSAALPGLAWKADVPKRGEVYTIIGIVLVNHRFRGPVDCLQLAEIRNTADQKEAYGAFRFRRVVERKTDISVFTEMLTPKRLKERV